MKRLYWILSLFIVLMTCGVIYVTCKKMPVRELPLSKESIALAIEKCDLPETLDIEENDVLSQEGRTATSYSLRREKRDIYAGHCMGILSRKEGKYCSLGINVSTIDEREELSEEELRQAVIFATHLFGGFRNEERVYKTLKKQVDVTDEFTWEKEIDGIMCQVKYTPDVAVKLLIGFEKN